MALDKDFKMGLFLAALALLTMIPAHAAEEGVTSEEASEKRWSNNIVPYVIAKNKTPFQRMILKSVIELYERFTCLRFDEYKNPNTIIPFQLLFRLQKDERPSFTEVKDGAGKTNYEIQCYTQISCFVMLSQALGLNTDTLSPNPERDYLVRYNFNNMDNATKEQFSDDSAKGVSTDAYDLSSFLRLHHATNPLGKGPSLTLLFPEYDVGYGYFYMMKQISNSFKCDESCPISTVCENDGYLTSVDGNDCTCRCVSGLDPANGCKQISKTDNFFQSGTTLQYPRGEYAIPRTADSCPSGFTKGHAIYGALELKLCLSKTSSYSDTWPAGNYCLHKKSSAPCPAGFKEGGPFIPITISRLRDQAPFCCKKSEFTSEEMFWPSREPITLIKYLDESISCQAIRGMHYTIEKTTLDHIHGANNFSPVDENGTIHYCHYTPATIGCGKVINLDSNKKEETFSAQGTELQCFWLIKAPEGEKIVVEFTEYDIGCDSGDELEIRYDRIGYPGQLKCGDQLKENYISFDNSFHIRFSTFGKASTSRFTAKATLIQNDDLGYNPKDRGQSYVGDVSFTRNFEECLPWSEVTHCPYHAYNYNAFNTILEGNYCRNPDQATGIMPWCYIKSRYCERNYCDVGLHRKRVDKKSNCAELNASGDCPLEGCALTCKDLYPVVDDPVSVSSIKCKKPTDVPEGTIVQAKKEEYEVGDVVPYKCNLDGSVVVNRVCLTSGEWSSLGTACPGVDSDEKKCLDVLDTCPDLFAQHPEMCSDFSEFAKIHCPFTCGLCSPSDDKLCNFVTRQHSPHFKRGETIKHQCGQTGMVPLDDVTRGCQVDGTMTASDVSCAPECADGWEYKIESRSCYKLNEKQDTYSNAQSTCKTLGGWVAMPKTTTQTDFLLDKLSTENATSYWIGVEYLADEDTFQYADGEEVGRSSDWADGQPIGDKDANCVQMNELGQWSEAPCDQNVNFACQVPIKIPSSGESSDE